ncbi:MAG: efflux RND transporter periplasmic adaptor subunit [Thermomonas sp.]|uniref:efflux RND transporter periplasmic adaptor subunit n=1 Tax=Thermomonas sp. TaxID=1971895 RepID=UPI0039E29E59
MHSRAAFVFALCSVLAAAGCAKGADPAAAAGQQMPPPEVGVVTLQQGDVALTKDLSGRLAAFRSADVRARVTGVLQKRVYEEGSDVRAGQLLFVIDPAQLQAALAQSQAALAQAQANHANAKASADRARTLLPQKFISQSDYDNALAAERSAAAAVQAARAAVQAANINLGYASVRAPIAGRAGQQKVTEGALVGQGEATLLTTVDQIDPLYVNFSLSVSELEQVRAAQSGAGASQVQVFLQDGTPYAHAGTLDFSGDVVDPATGAVALRARIPNPDRSLLPGSYVSVRATLGQQRGVFLVPQAAVQRDAQGAYVLVVGQDGKVVRKDITANQAQGTNWVVRDGVASGDQVIVSGLQRAQPGQPAKAAPVQQRAAPAGAPAAPANEG